MARLTAEEKTVLARILEAEDDEDEDEVEDVQEVEEEDSDEFTYRGKRYVYTPEEVEEVREEVKAKKKAPARAAPAKKTAASKPATQDVEPVAARRRFVT